ARARPAGAGTRPGRPAGRALRRARAGAGRVAAGQRRRRGRDALLVGPAAGRRRPPRGVGAAARPPLSPAPCAYVAPELRLGEFVSDHGILLLSYTGAFLLVVATVLYELYGVTGLGGGARFAGVLGLDVVFGVAGWACLRSRQTHPTKSAPHHRDFVGTPGM